MTSWATDCKTTFAPISLQTKPTFACLAGLAVKIKSVSSSYLRLKNSGSALWTLC
jgi:hypothetical protein